MNMRGAGEKVATWRHFSYIENVPDQNPNFRSRFVIERKGDVFKVPSNLTAKGVTSNKITLSWTQDVYGSLCPLQKYDISWTSSVEASEAGYDVIDSTATTYTLSDLAACTPYVFTLRSVNSEGSSDHTNNTVKTTEAGKYNIDGSTEEHVPQSYQLEKQCLSVICSKESLELSLPVMNLSVPVPDAPPSLDCQSAENGYEFTVAWTKPEKNNCLKNYRVTYTGQILWSSEVLTETDSVPDTNIHLRDLIPYTKYNVCVAGDIGSNTYGNYACCTTTTPEERE
ncbi:hypothetical protein SK128_000631 [Halocaridina rubra]|uniref:Fibronectin type-III domain-containing protein n=1 Tax=Halocaridina rubra TaxID=373956 RepID=A0AAN8X1T3_HALRR